MSQLYHRIVRFLAIEKNISWKPTKHTSKQADLTPNYARRPHTCPGRLEATGRMTARTHALDGKYEEQ